MGRGDSRVLSAVLVVLVCGLVAEGATSTMAAEPNLVGYWRLDGAAKEIGVLAEAETVAPPLPPAASQGAIAVGHDSRIDLRWPLDTDPNLEGYNIYRAAADGPFTKLNDSVYKAPVYSDFFGVNGRTYPYYVRAAAIRNGGESEPSNVVSAASYAMTDGQLLTSVQEAVFRYFWDYGHPVSGLAREGYGFSPWGYSAHSPTNDNGTISPTAALERHAVRPDRIPRDAASTSITHTAGISGAPSASSTRSTSRKNWFAPGYIAIDQGPIVVVIENYRTHLCWDLFMSNPEIQPMLDAIGWTSP